MEKSAKKGLTNGETGGNITKLSRNGAATTEKLRENVKKVVDNRDEM